MKRAIGPAKLAWGLKAVALKLGVRLYENTPFQKISSSRKILTVVTPDAEIKAEKILLATNAFASGHKRLRKRVVAIRDRIIATEPLSDEKLARIGWTNRQGVYDTRTQMNYMRLTKDNRIIFGGRLGYYYGDNTDPEGDKVKVTYSGWMNTNTKYTTYEDEGEYKVLVTAKDNAGNSAELEVIVISYSPASPISVCHLPNSSRGGP